MRHYNSVVCHDLQIISTLANVFKCSIHRTLARHSSLSHADDSFVHCCCDRSYSLKSRGQHDYRCYSYEKCVARSLVFNAGRV